jgi:hypothetical protein
MTYQNDPPVKMDSVLDELRMDEYRDPTPLEDDDPPTWEQETEFLEWYLKGMTALDAEEGLVKEQYNRMMNDIANSKRLLMESHAAEFERIALERISQQKNTSQIRLFHGDISARKYRSSMRVTDSDLAVQWALQNRPEITRTRVTVNFMEYIKSAKEMSAETGEVPPGITITEPKTVLYYPGKPKGVSNEDE